MSLEEWIEGFQYSERQREVSIPGEETNMHSGECSTRKPMWLKQSVFYEGPGLSEWEICI